MNEKQKPRQKRLDLDTPNEELRVIDVVRYLSDLARLHSSEKIGNVALSEGLRNVSKALRPYGKYRTSELIGLTRDGGRRKPAGRGPSQDGPRLPDDLSTMSQTDVEHVLEDLTYTKLELVEVGASRFGISRSKLARSPKNEAIDTIRAALAHEKSLDLISKEATKSGGSRSN